MSKKAFDLLFTEEEVRATAELASIELDDERAARLADALRVILEHFAVIERVEQSNESERSPVESHGELDKVRDDVVEAPDAASAIGSAPDFEDGFFFVPRITE